MSDHGHTKSGSTGIRVLGVQLRTPAVGRTGLNTAQHGEISQGLVPKTGFHSAELVPLAVQYAPTTPACVASVSLSKAYP